MFVARSGITAHGQCGREFMQFIAQLTVMVMVGDKIRVARVDPCLQFAH
jgi:hypothetical protein